MALSTGLTVAAVIVGVAFMWSDSRLASVRAVVGSVARRTDSWRWRGALGVVGLALFAGFALLPQVGLLADQYGAAQLVGDAEELRGFVDSGGSGLYVATVFYDVVFAAVYGLFALSLAPPVRRWRDDRSASIARRAGSVACGVLVAGAAFDELENGALLLAILYGDSSSGSRAIAAMAWFGAVKWALLVVGAAALAGAATLRLLTRPATTRWLRRAWIPYAAYLTLVVAFVIAATVHQRWTFWLLMPALVICGSWLNSRVMDSRDPDAVDSVTFGATRTRLSIVQLMIGLGLGVFGLDWAGVLGDTAVVLGLALVILSLGSLVSEFRQLRWHPVGVSRAMFVTAAALVGASWFVSGTATWVLFGGAVLIGELATELGAETVQNESATPWPIAALSTFNAILVLTLMAALATLMLVFPLGVELRFALALAAALIGVVWMASIDGDSLVLVGLLALALIASTRPGDLEVDESLEAAAGQPYILVLGDSYTSGEGATAYIPGTNEVVSEGLENSSNTNECRQAPTAWAFQLAEKAAFRGVGDDGPAFPSRVLFLGCSGAVTENIRETPRVDSEGNKVGPAQLVLFRERKQALGSPALVIVGIGGNDAGFGDIGQACIGPGSCAELAEQFLLGRLDRSGRAPAEGWPEALADISDDLDQTYTAIRHEVGPGIPIVATGYPSPIAEGGRCSGALLTHDERQFIAGFVTQLNATIRAATEASNADVSFMDLSSSLARRGSQICAAGPGDAGINFLAFGSKGGTIRDSLNPAAWTHNSLHPNVRGHTALAEDAYEWLTREWPPTSPVRDRLDPPPIEPAQLVAQLGPQCDPTSRPCRVDGGEWLGAQAHRLYRDSIVWLALAVFALRLAFLPLVAAGRRSRLSVFGCLRDTWNKI